MTKDCGSCKHWVQSQRYGNLAPCLGLGWRIDSTSITGEWSMPREVHITRGEKCDKHMAKELAA